MDEKENGNEIITSMKTFKAANNSRKNRFEIFNLIYDQLIVTHLVTPNDDNQ